ncbi:LOW QUALITY PROTEIN: uncharacterized protein [Polyergus mexicanus]|uniref:LOW QUALITY PROTEIN: uncharacterized protein n=1 Tax=Polyergus mexicanus TaxID=615972 RepID=UPI0038B5EE71
MKRSYRTGRYDSLSGVGTICGARTGKVLHMSVRNKYCAVCVKTEKLKKEPASHKCYKNWNRDCSLTSMEADAIVEEFKTSIEKRGLIYSTYIADGDSSVYKKIIQANLYPNVFIEKIECRNHLLRNLASKIKEIAKTKGRFGKLKNVFDNRVLRIRTTVTKAVKYRLEEQNTMQQKITSLKIDLDNIISHVFGEHNECAKIGYFCNGSQKENEENYILQLKKCGLYEKLQTALKYISWNAKSLLQNKDSNRVETFNSVISKCIGGKRINFGLRGSYETCCNAAVVTFNIGKPISHLSYVLGTKPAEIATQLETNKKISVRNTPKRLTQRNIKRAVADRDYGPQADKPDATSAEVELRKVQHMHMLRDWQMKRVDIEEETKEQAATGIWRYYRTKMISASHFGHICKMRKSTSCASRVKSIIYPQQLNVESVQHGKEYEDVARESIESALNINIKRCGLFIDSEIPFLGASPDGLIEDDGIVEIKCPFAARFLTPEDAIATNVSNLQSLYNKKSLYNEKNEEMKRNHILYYYQIQGQLHITQRQYCIFALWTPLGLKMEKIIRDDIFWTENMVSKLIQFYEDCILPELLDPRVERNMPIREPEYIIEAKRRSDYYHNAFCARRSDYYHNAFCARRNDYCHKAFCVKRSYHYQNAFCVKRRFLFLPQHLYSHVATVNSEFYGDYSGALTHGPLVVIACSRQNESIKSATVDVRIEFDCKENIPSNTTVYCLIIHDRVVE